MELIIYGNNRNCKKIKEAGGNLYLVGGAVRDLLLGRERHDEDYVVTQMSSERFKELFPESYLRGKSFEVFDIDGKEFAMARKERKNGKGHTEFIIETNENITIEEDLKRRDITINSIAKDVLTGEIIDPFDGKNDIKNKVIKATSEAFCEDPLRVYRVARFATQLQFDVDENTLKMMENIKQELKYLSAERVFEELKKALNCSKPSIFFEVLRKANVLDEHFKEIYDLIGSLQPEKYHPEGDAYRHTMLALDKSAELTEDLAIRFSVLVHDLGKGLTPKEMYPHHYDHDIKGVDLVGNLGRRLKIPTIWIKCGKTAARQHMRAGIFYKMSISKKVSFIEEVSKSILGLEGLEIVVEADRNCRGTESQKVCFAQLGKMMCSEINGKYIFDTFGLKSDIKVKTKLHEERIKWLKKNSDKI